ncbi:MAG: LemA family protein [Bacteroidales bacterium]|nr:LemA family protein [Bacteroidales bacterium]
MNYIIGIGIALVIIVWVVIIYNSLVQLLNQVENAWAQIDVQLKRRYDLIPNLLETVKTYMKYESEIFEKITMLRANAMNASSVQEKGNCEGLLTGALGQFKVAVENYPDLKANANFLALQEELASTENKIAFSRQNYNDQVLFYNNKIKMVPSNIIAGMFSFKVKEFFQIDASERMAPKI